MYLYCNNKTIVLETLSIAYHNVVANLLLYTIWKQFTLSVATHQLGVKTSRRNLRKDKSSQWETDSSSSEEEKVPTKREKIEKEEDEEDEWHAMEKEREKDLLERDALNERIKKKDKEKTRKIMEKSDKKVIV